MLTNQNPLTLVERIQRRLGKDVVLLNVASGEKRPVEKGWQKFTVEKMRDPAYLETLNHGGNIGVLLGKNSGGIHTIDIDLDAAVDPFLALNPKLASTYRTTRVRGGNLWLRVTGACPPSGKLKTRDGEDWGEWRGDGNQTVIFGQAIDRKKGETEPTRYRVANRGEVVTMAFEEIVWPQELVLPWSGSDAEGNGTKRNKPDKAAVASMLAFIPPRPDYPEWLRIIAAVGDALNDDDTVEVLSAWSPEEQPGEYLEKLRSGMNRVSVGTLFHIAEENGWTRPGKLYTGNDAGRAEEFVDNHAEAIRYVPAWNRWLIWAGHYWQPDEDGAIMRLAVSHSTALIRAAAQIPDHRQRAEAVREALKMGDSGRIEKMMELAKCDVRIVARHEHLDAEPFLLGVRNGVVELRTGLFREGRREDLITKRVGTDYVKGARCLRWLAFLDVVLANNTELIAYVQKLVGYTLTGDVSGQCFPFLFGSGKNGKTKFTETLQRLLGDYGQRAPSSLLTASNNGREPTHEIARLHGARLVIGSETEEGARLAESRVKDLTGGDTLTGRFLYAEAFDFRPCLKLWMFGNHKPEIRGTDDGIWRRVRLIPFTVQIPEGSRDPHLAEKLAAELPGILQWALEGTRLWLAHGLTAPSTVTEASADYREEEDTLADFIAGQIKRVPNARTGLAELFSRYQTWADCNGMRYPLTQRALTKRLKERGFKQPRTRDGRFWADVELK